MEHIKDINKLKIEQAKEEHKLKMELFKIQIQQQISKYFLLPFFFGYFPGKLI